MKLKQKISNLVKHISIVIGTAAIMLQILVIPVLADTNSGLNTAKDNVINQLKPIINTVVVPILLVLLGGGLLFAIVHAVYSYRKGRDVELGWIIGLIIGITLVATFPTWGWQLIAG